MNTKTVRVRRTYLVRRVQEISCEIPAEYDIEEWMTNDWLGFDQYVCDNGDIETQAHEPVDEDELDLQVLSQNRVPAARLVEEVAAAIQLAGHDAPGTGQSRNEARAQAAIEAVLNSEWFIEQTQNGG